MLVQTSGGFRSTTPLASPVPEGEFTAGAKKAATPRVLVVDDEALVRWSIAETLHGAGYEVFEAADAESALRLLLWRHATPDLVLLDLRLPDCGDLRLLQTLRLLLPAARIILMTSFGTPEIAEAARQSGAYAVLDKPFDLDSLARLVDVALA